MAHKNLTIYEGEFSGLRLHAFGIKQVLDYRCVIQIYQKRANPELWCARPVVRTGAHKWEATTAEQLMNVIENDWMYCVRMFAPTVIPLRSVSDLLKRKPPEIEAKKA